MRPIGPIINPNRSPAKATAAPTMPAAIPSSARKNDRYADPIDRKRAQAARASGRGLIDPETAERNEAIVWFWFGLLFFANSVLTSAYGINAIYRHRMHLDDGQVTPTWIYLVGIAVGLSFIFGQIGLAPGIIRRYRNRWPTRIENVVLYLFVCMLPDTLSTAIGHYFLWVASVLEGTHWLIYWLGVLVLCGSMALLSSWLPLMAVIKREERLAP
jgi:hypothetical protein